MTVAKRTRLTDILTKEVSLVDRAANKRVFILTKADGEPMSAELLSDGKGGFVTPSAVAPARPELVSVVEKLTALANAPVPAAGELEIAKAVSDVVAPLVIAEPKGLPTEFAPLAKAEPAEIQKMVIGAIAKLSEIAAALGQTPDTDPGVTRWNISDALSGIVELARLEQAMATVASMPAAVGKAEEAVVEAVVLEPVPEPVPELAADIEKYRALAKSLKNTLDSAVGIAHDTVVNKATDFDPTSAAKLLDDSTKVIKSLQTRIATLEGAVVTPNALPVEGVAKSASVSWPTDMNRDDSGISF